MAPSVWVTMLLTPERWPFLPAPIAARVTRRIAFDTTGLARVLRRINPLSYLRGALVPRSARLQALDWRLRKAFWTAQWCLMVGFQGWPRRTPRTRDESPIRLLPAPRTYADFQSPALVVPETVPHAEKSLLNQMTVQLVHLLQDIYPIVSSHQPSADPDPQKRFDRAYTRTYRWFREPPRWHPDLVAASNDRNLLGVLAVGGPFAKLLQRTDPQRSDYVIDLEHFVNYRVREGLCHLGCRIRFASPGNRLVVTAIEYEGEVIAPGSPRWEWAERIALAALMTHVTVWRQGMEYHVGGLAPVPVLTHNLLPPDHPLRRLLAPHINQTMTTNFHTHLTLRRSGFDVTGFTFPYETILRYYDDGAASFDITRLDVALDASQRGIPQSLEYPYLPQALAYYRLFWVYVRRYVEQYYPDERALASDAAVREWFEALDRTIVRGVRRYVPDVTVDGLVKLLTLLLYSLTVGHTENSLFNYAVFMPTTVRRDGVQQSVGQVQDIVNFQFLITAPTTLLVADHSHIALDSAGAAIMNAFRDSLLKLQREMETQPGRHWQLFPNAIEGSVSC
jgi:hypothetical protein